MWKFHVQSLCFFVISDCLLSFENATFEKKYILYLMIPNSRIYYCALLQAVIQSNFQLCVCVWGGELFICFLNLFPLMCTNLRESVPLRITCYLSCFSLQQKRTFDQYHFSIPQKCRYRKDYQAQFPCVLSQSSKIPPEVFLKKSCIREPSVSRCPDIQTIFCPSAPHIPSSYGSVYPFWIPSVLFPDTEGQCGPGSKLNRGSAPRFRIVCECACQDFCGEVCACTCVWMCLRVHVYMHMCICVWCLSELLITDITTNRSPQSYFPKLLYYEYINDQENTGGLSIKFYKPTSEPLQILESYHERGNLQT